MSISKKYAAIIVRQYAEGRICIVSDRIGGYLSNEGGSASLWRNLLEWTGQRHPSETISIGVINSSNIPYRNKLATLFPLSFREISLNNITYGDISDFDMLYFIGLPSQAGTILENTIEDYVKNGGGVYIEVPDISGEIEILKSIESINCTSINRPLFGNAYWTPSGKIHDVFIEPVNVGFLTTLELASFSSDWTPLMTNEPSDEISEQEITIITTDKIGSEFGIGFTVAMQKGMVEIDTDMSSSSSSSIDSSSSSSSSSAEEYESWDFCDNIVAYWKLDDNINSPVVWDDSHDFQHLGILKNGSTPIYTSSCHVDGVVNGALSFNGTSQRIQTYSNQTLNFIDISTDAPFSVSLWIYPISSSGYILCKSGVWEIYLSNSILSMTFHSSSGYRTYNMSGTIPLNQWSNVTLAYNGLFSGMSMYLNSALQNQTRDQAGYTIMNDLNSSLYFASDISTSHFQGYIDNIFILNKKVNDIEVEVLWNIGRGNDQCSGIYRYSSSSSSSTSSSSTSSSSSIDSSSSSSTSSIDSSSSSSTSSIDSSSSSSTSSSSSESQS